MKLQEKIMFDIKQSMLNKESEKLSILRVVKGEIDRIGKGLSDDEIMKIMKKMKLDSDASGNIKESEILSTYLPTILEEKQLEVIIDGIILKNNFNSMKDMRFIMSELKQNYGQSIDGKIASNIIKNKLK